MIDTLVKSFSFLFGTERYDDYQRKYNWYVEKLNKCENADEEVKTIKNILLVIIDY